MKNEKIEKTRKTIYIDASVWKLIERHSAKIERSENWTIREILTKWAKKAR
jgi:hypothetical protein